jgi:hypothetical protein
LRGHPLQTERGPGFLIGELAEGPVANPGNSTVFRDRHQTTDKWRGDKHRKLIRISARAPRVENSYVIAEYGLGQL